MSFIFGKTKNLISKIDTFIDLTAQATLHFKEGLGFYLSNEEDDFLKRIEIINEIERDADRLSKDIESQLYVQTLIPESRGDVLGILERMDSIIDLSKSTIFDLHIERPVVPKEIEVVFAELIVPVVKSVESLTFAVRAYFYDVNAVKDHLHLVKYYEKDADLLYEKIIRKTFSLEIDLAEKLHLKEFAKHIDGIADRAEEVSNRVAIATIKRIV